MLLTENREDTEFRVHVKCGPVEEEGTQRHVDADKGVGNQYREIRGKVRLGIGVVSANKT